jgi:hypothetical protein
MQSTASLNRTFLYLTKVRHLLEMFKVKTITIKNSSGCRLRFAEIGQVTSCDEVCCYGSRVDVCDVASLWDRARCFSVEIATGWHLINEIWRERRVNEFGCYGNKSFVPPIECSYGVVLPLESAAMLPVDLFPMCLTKCHVTNQFLLSCHVTASVQINYTAFQIFSATFKTPCMCPSSLPFVFVTPRTQLVFPGLSRAVCWSCRDVSMYFSVAVFRVNFTSTEGTRSHERGSVDFSYCDDADMYVKASRLWLV